MKLGQLKKLRAGNHWCKHPVVQIELVFDESEDRDLAEGVRRTLCEHTSFFLDESKNFDAWKDFCTRPTRLSQADAVAAVALLLQRSLYWPVGFRAVAAGTGELVVVETRKHRVGQRAAEAAVEIVAEMADGPDDPLAYLKARTTQFHRAAARATPAFDTLKLVEKADERGIPWESLKRATFVRLGTGPHAKMLFCSESSDLSRMASRMAHMKPVTAAMLTQAGLPVPKYKSVRSEKGALKAVAAIGGPVVIKPAKGRQGKGVSVGIETEADIRDAVVRAREISRDVQIEAMIPGEEYRLLVIGGAFVAASHRQAARVVGDGTRTIAELVAEENERPERFPMAKSRHSMRHPIPLDELALDCLARQGLDPEAVPEPGAVVSLRSVSNASQGGTAVDVTGRVHPSVRDIAERAARALKLDLCGVDYITTDITRAHSDVGGAICEVNSQPGLTLHHVVEGEVKRDVYAEYLKLLFPEGTQVRLPTVILVDPPKGSDLRRAVEKLFAGSGKRLGVYRRRAGPKRLEAPVTARDGSVVRFDRLTALLTSEDIDAALVVLRSSDIVRRGAQVNIADLAVLPGPPKTISEELSRDALGRIVGTDNIFEHTDGIEMRIAETLGVDPTAVRNEDAPEALADAAAKAPATPKARRREAASVAVRPLEARPQKSKAKSKTGAAPKKKAEPGVPKPAPARAAPIPKAPDGAARALFVGDIGFGESYVDHARAKPLKALLATRGHSASLERVAGLVAGADLALGNLEVPLNWKVDPNLEGRKRYLGWADPDRTADALREAGFTALSLANNHALDGGQIALAQTRDRLAEADMQAFGGGGDEAEAARPFIRDLGPVTLVVFAGFARRRQYARDFDWYADGDKGGVASLDPGRIGRAIAELRDQLTAPIFVAFPHWGTDYKDVTKRQRADARALVGAGVDLVIGHGAHVLQPVELIDGRPVVYGLGNFVWNAPGRFAKTGAPPFGAACALDVLSPEQMSLKLYPLLTDTSQTGFQNRPVSSMEFREAQQVISSGLGTRLARRGPAHGRYCELIFDAGTWRPDAWRAKPKGKSPDAG